MIKFFRKIRQQLLTENRFTKYLLYAIGEIILVVIGILIALQINNTNEAKKSEERTKQLLIKVQKELLLNIENINHVIEFYRNRDSIIYKVLNKKASYNDYKNNNDYAALIFEYEEGFIVDDAFKNFIDSYSYNELSIEQDSIVIKLKRLYGVLKVSVNNSERMIKERVGNNFNKLEKEKEWFTTFVHAGKPYTDEMITYFLNDPLYLNNVSGYAISALQDQFSNTLYFRNVAILINEEISEGLNLKKDSLIVKKLKGFEHYIGTYQADSLTTLKIKSEKKALIIYRLNQQDSSIISKTKVFPDSKNYFTYWDVFGRLIFDKNNEVVGLVLTNGTFRKEYKKVD